MSVGLSVECVKLTKLYSRSGAAPLPVLRELDLAVEPGDRVAIVGKSGSGKSTLLQLLGLLDNPTSGEIRLGGTSTRGMWAGQRARLRNHSIGFVFQSHHLLPEHTAHGNVLAPMLIAGCSRSTANARADAFLDAVGLRERSTHRPSELSGGEQQRVALARALVMGPGLVLADEPTGNLDPATASGVFDLMLSLHEQIGNTLLVVTHSMDLAARFPRRIVLTDGRFDSEPNGESA